MFAEKNFTYSNSTNIWLWDSPNKKKITFLWAWTDMWVVFLLFGRTPIYIRQRFAVFPICKKTMKYFSLSGWFIISFHCIKTLHDWPQLFPISVCDLTCPVLRELYGLPSYLRVFAIFLFHDASFLFLFLPFPIWGVSLSSLETCCSLLLHSSLPLDIIFVSRSAVLGTLVIFSIWSLNLLFNLYITFVFVWIFVSKMRGL